MDKIFQNRNLVLKEKRKGANPFGRAFEVSLKLNSVHTPKKTKIINYGNSSIELAEELDSESEEELELELELELEGTVPFLLTGLGLALSLEPIFRLRARVNILVLVWSDCESSSQ